MAMHIQAYPPYSDTTKVSVKVKPIALSLLGADAPGITTEQSNDVQRVIQSLMDRPWPEWYPQPEPEP